MAELIAGFLPYHLLFRYASDWIRRSLTFTKRKRETISSNAFTTNHLAMSHIVLTQTGKKKKKKESLCVNKYFAVAEAFMIVKWWIAWHVRNGFTIGVLVLGLPIRQTELKVSVQVCKLFFQVRYSVHRYTECLHVIVSLHSSFKIVWQWVYDRPWSWIYVPRRLILAYVICQRSKMGC